MEVGRLHGSRFEFVKRRIASSNRKPMECQVENAETRSTGVGAESWHPENLSINHSINESINKSLGIYIRAFKTIN